MAAKALTAIAAAALVAEMVGTRLNGQVTIAIARRQPVPYVARILGEPLRMAGLLASLLVLLLGLGLGVKRWRAAYVLLAAATMMFSFFLV